MKIKLKSDVVIALDYDSATGVDVDIAAFVVTGHSVPRLVSDSSFFYYDNTGSYGSKARYVEDKGPTLVKRSIRVNTRLLDTYDREKVVIVAAIYRAEDRKQTFSSTPITLTVAADNEVHTIRLDEEYPHFAALQIGHVWDKAFQYLGHPVNVDFRAYLGLFRPSAKVIY